MNTLNARTRFTATLRDWLTAVEAIKPANMDRPADAPNDTILGRVLITWGHGGAEFTATTFSTSIRFRITGETGYYGTGATVLDYQELARTLATYGTKSTQRRITVSCERDGANVVLGDDKLDSIDPDGYIEPDEFGGRLTLLARMGAREFKRLIKHTGRALGTKSQFDALGLMRLSSDAVSGLVRAEATDNYRLVRGHEESMSTSGFSRVVQGRTLRSIARFVDGDMVELREDRAAHHVVLRSDRIDAVFRAERDDLPDFGPHLARPCETQTAMITVDRRGLLEQTAQAVRSAKSVAQDARVVIHRDMDRVTVQPESPEAAQSLSEPLRGIVGVAQAPTRTLINGRFLADALKTRQGRNVTLHFLAKNLPVTVADEGQGLAALGRGYHVQIMPIREPNADAA